MLRAGSILALAVLAGCGDDGSAEARRRPNVLLVFTDDQRFDSLAITGNPFLETPTLDRIAAEGILFGRAYVTTSRCCPGRASMLTGKYATAHGVWNNKPEHEFPGEQRTIADYLDAAGYVTAWFGKWHLPNPGGGPVRGFDRWASYEGPGSHFDQTFNVDGQEVQSQGFQADWLAARALDFLDEQRGDEPFFLTLAFKNPHVPMTPAPRHAGKLADADIRLPESASDPDASLPAFYRGVRSMPENRHGIDDPDQYRADVRAYWELVLSIDDNVQRVLEALERSGRLDDTIVVLTTDNGQLLGEHGLQQKGLSYEPSIRIPFCMRYPRAIPAGTRSEALVANVDLAPTLLDLVGLEVPADMHGRSLAALWEGTGAPWRDSLLYLGPSFGQEGTVERTLVEARWKYVHFQVEGREAEALFDRESDPDERRDVADDPANVEVLERMRARLATELERVGG